MLQWCSGWILPFYQFQVPEDGAMLYAAAGCKSMKLMRCGALVVTSSQWWGRNLAGHDHELCLPFPPLCQQTPKPKDRMFHQSQKRPNSLHEQVTFKALQKQKACSRLTNHHGHITLAWSLPKLATTRLVAHWQVGSGAALGNDVQYLGLSGAVDQMPRGEDLVSERIYFILPGIQRCNASVYAYTMHKHVRDIPSLKLT